MSSFFLCIFILLLFDWKVIKSDHFTIMYKESVSWQAYRVLQQAEKYKPIVDNIIGSNSTNLPMVVEDVGMYANGFADPFMGHIHIYTHTPNSNTSLEGLENWLRSVTLHEQTHGVHLTHTRGLATICQRVFGSIFNTNMYVPGWLIEGMAVYTESQVSPYEGRLNDGFYTGYIDTRVQNDRLPSLVEVTNKPLYFPYDTYYLYGGGFFDFLADRYGTEQFSKFFSVYGKYLWAPVTVFLPCLGIDAAARCTYGHTFPYLYNEWRVREQRGKATWYGNAERCTQQGWYIYSVTACDRNIYYVHSQSNKIDVYNVFTRYSIMVYDPKTNTTSSLRCLQNPVTAPLRCHDQVLYYATRELKYGLANITFNGFGITATLQRIDLRTGCHEVLVTDDIRAFCVLGKDSILFSTDRKDTFGSVLWIYTPAGYDSIGVSRYLIQELLWTGQHVVGTCKDEFQNPDIYTIDMDHLTLVQRVSTPWTEAFLTYIDENTVGFTSNINGVHGLYEMNLNSNTIWHIQVQGYARSGIVVSSYPNKIYFVGLNSLGYDLYCQTFERLLCELPQSEIREYRHDTVASLHAGTYIDIVKSILPKVRTPLFLPKDRYLNTWLMGGLFLGEDALQENTYYIFVAYDNEYDEPYMRLQWNSRTLSPLVTHIYYENDYVNYSLVLPIYSRLHTGLNRATLFLSGKSFEQFSRKEVSPGISWTFRYPYTGITCLFVLPYERRAWSSSIDRSAQMMSLSLEQVILTGILTWTVRGFSDLHNPDSQQITIQGLDPILTPQGLDTRLEYSHKLFSMRWGLWNPNIYCEDMFASIYFDYGRTHDRRNVYSLGIELETEFKLGFGYIQITPCVGCAVTHNGDITWYAQIHTPTNLPYFQNIVP